MASKLYVGGLSYSTTSDGLREFFSQSGSVLSATVITDRFSGQSRGFGFVEMDSAEGAQNAISQINGRELDGRRITVERPCSVGSSQIGGTEVKERFFIGVEARFVASCKILTEYSPRARRDRRARR